MPSKSPAQLDREIAQSLGKRIDRKKLASMMFPWGSDSAYGQGSGAIGAVASYFVDGKKYPDRAWVERALKAIEADIPKADHGAHGWTKADGKDLRTIAGGLRYYLIHDYKNGNAHSTIKTDEQWQAQVTQRRKRDPGAWSSRDKLISIARAAANNVFFDRKVMTPALIKKAKEAAFKAIRRFDPLAGTSDHPAAAYSHGVSELAAEGTSQAALAWVPAKQIRVTWAKAGKKLVSHDKRFAIVKDNGGYNLIDLDTYNEYPVASLEAAKSKAAQLR